VKSSQRYLKFWDKEKIRKNCVSRKDAKAPRFGEIDNKSFFASLAAWRDNIFCHFSLENKMLETNSQTSECKKLIEDFFSENRLAAPAGISSTKRVCGVARR
jgi:hypothetical protein